MHVGNNLSLCFMIEIFLTVFSEVWYALWSLKSQTLSLTKAGCKSYKQLTYREKWKNYDTFWLISKVKILKKTFPRWKCSRVQCSTLGPHCSGSLCEVQCRASVGLQCLNSIKVYQCLYLYLYVHMTLWRQTDTTKHFLSTVSIIEWRIYLCRVKLVWWINIWQTQLTAGRGPHIPLISTGTYLLLWLPGWLM